MSSSLFVIASLIVILGEGNLLFSTHEINTRVAAGGNGSAWDSFSPQSVEIHVGDSVTWSNPSPVSEPHTVTFLTNQSYFPPLAAPFNIPNSTQVASTLQDPNAEPIYLPIS